MRQLLLASLAAATLLPPAAMAQPLVKSAIQVDAGNTRQAGATSGYRLT